MNDYFIAITQNKYIDRQLSFIHRDKKINPQS